MASDTENVKLGVCRIFYDGEDLGYTKGGVEVEVTTETHRVEVDQFGKSPVNEIIMGRNCSVSIPLAETTLENMVRIMPGATLVQEGGVKATGSVTFSSAAPVNNDSVTIAGVVYTFKTTPVGSRDLAIPGSVNAAAAALAAAINLDEAVPVKASAALGVVTLTHEDIGAAGNAVTVAKSGTNIAVSGATLTTGADSTKAKVQATHGIGTSLLAIAKRLVLHPVANADDDVSEDFVIPRAATAGALTFAYKLDEERVFNTNFTAYPDPVTKVLFVVGDESATA